VYVVAVSVNVPVAFGGMTAGWGGNWIETREYEPLRLTLGPVVLLLHPIAPSTIEAAAARVNQPRERMPTPRKAE